jgi:acyl carrier protein
MTQPPDPAADPRTTEILDVFARAADTDRAALRLDASVTELGIASLDMVQAVFELETHYNIDIPALPEQAGAEFGTVGDLVRMVLARLDRPAPAA